MSLLYPDRVLKFLKKNSWDMHAAEEVSQTCPMSGTGTHPK